MRTSAAPNPCGSRVTVVGPPVAPPNCSGSRYQTEMRCTWKQERGSLPHHEVRAIEGFGSHLRQEQRYCHDQSGDVVPSDHHQ